LGLKLVVAATVQRRVKASLCDRQSPPRHLVELETRRIGKTPLQTFLDAKPLAKEKLIAA
jgi:hypothetical protein